MDRGGLCVRGQIMDLFFNAAQTLSAAVSWVITTRVFIFWFICCCFCWCQSRKPIAFHSVQVFTDCAAVLMKLIFCSWLTVEFSSVSYSLLHMYFKYIYSIISVHDTLLHLTYTYRHWLANSLATLALLARRRSLTTPWASTIPTFGSVSDSDCGESHTHTHTFLLHNKHTHRRQRPPCLTSWIFIVVKYWIRLWNMFCCADELNLSEPCQ